MALSYYQKGLYFWNTAHIPGIYCSYKVANTLALRHILTTGMLSVYSGPSVYLKTTFSDTDKYCM